MQEETFFVLDKKKQLLYIGDSGFVQTSKYQNANFDIETTQENENMSFYTAQLDESQADQSTFFNDRSVHQYP